LPFLKGIVLYVKLFDYMCVISQGVNENAIRIVS
jgi:hypothetical protein